MSTDYEFLADRVETWEQRVFMAACDTGYFTAYCRFAKREDRRKEFNNFPEAAMYAMGHHGLVYAVTASGRSVCIPRVQYQAYLDMWKGLQKKREKD